MRTRLPGFLLIISLTATAVTPGLAGTTPGKADIARLVDQAASYQPGQSREAFRKLEELLRQPSAAARKDLEVGLVRLLGAGSSYEAREFACVQLGIIGSRSALPALAELLQSDDTAGIACLALTTYPPGKADSVLRTALKSATGAAQIQIINTLGDRRDAKAVKPLGELARGADQAVARAAIAALGKIANRAAWDAIVGLPLQAAPALQPVLTEALLRQAAARAEGGDTKAAVGLYEELLADSHPAYIRRAAFAALLGRDQEGARKRVLAVLRGSDSVLKPVAIARVRDLSAADTSEVFAAELPKLQPQEQVWLIDSLAARGDAAAGKAIANSLASPDGAVRRASINALRRTGDTWGVVSLAGALSRASDVEERRAIESALIALRGGARTDQAITVALKESTGATRADLITVLARRQGPAANALLLAEAVQSEPVVAKSALRALAKTAGEKELTPLLERLTGTRDAGVRSEAENAAAQAVARTEKPARRSELVCAALGWAQDAESRGALLELLPGCGDAVALGALQKATTDSDPAVREAAVRALAEWPDLSAWDALAAIYRQPDRESQRGLALRGLVRLAGEANAHPDAKLVERYKELLAGCRNDADRRLVLGALGGAAQPGALELALPLLDNAGVRAEAEVAVKKIAEAIKAQHPQAAQEALKRVQSAAKAQ